MGLCHPEDAAYLEQPKIKFKYVCVDIISILYNDLDCFGYGFEFEYGLTVNTSYVQRAEISAERKIQKL